MDPKRFAQDLLLNLISTDILKLNTLKTKSNNEEVAKNYLEEGKAELIKTIKINESGKIESIIKIYEMENPLGIKIFCFQFLKYKSFLFLLKYSFTENSNDKYYWSCCQLNSKEFHTHALPI